MEKNQKEKQVLYDWGVENYSEDIFVRIDDAKKSYFSQRGSDSYIRKYAFDTAREFMDELNMLWEDDEKMDKIKKAIGVAAMKNKPVAMEQEKEQLKVQTEGLSEFIYNF